MKTCSSVQDAEELVDVYRTNQILKEGLEGRFPNPHEWGTPPSFEHERTLVTMREEMLPGCLGLMRETRKKLLG